MTRNPECKKCDLYRGCSTVCLWGEGNLQSKLMIVGEAPGKDEDAEGRPFCGKSGRLLDHCLAYLAIKREDVYITNAIKCRPPENKLPGTKDERQGIVTACTPYFEAEFQQLKPKVILALGKTALEVLTEGECSNMAAWQGRMYGFYKRTLTRLYVAYHPAFILRKPSEERRLTAAIKNAALATGIPVKINPGKIFNYEDFRS
jgi:uracil-DNA glycosylase